jgi:hypothetical protein
MPISGKINRREFTSQARGNLDGLLWTWSNVRPTNLVNGSKRIEDLIGQGVLTGESISQAGLKHLLLKFAETIPCFSEQCPLHKMGLCEPLPHPYPAVFKPEIRAITQIDDILRFAVFPIAAESLKRMPLTKDTMPVDFAPLNLDLGNAPFAA